MCVCSLWAGVRFVCLCEVEPSSSSVDIVSDYLFVCVSRIGSLFMLLQSLQFASPAIPDGSLEPLPYQDVNEAALFILQLFEWRANHLTQPAPPLDPHVFLGFNSFHAE